METFRRVVIHSLSAPVAGYGAWKGERSEFHPISQPPGARDPETRARRDASLTRQNSCFSSSDTCAAPPETQGP